MTTLGIGDLLYGKVSPAGRMVQTIYPASYQDEVSIFDFNMRPGPSPFPRPDCTTQPQSQCPNGTNPGRTHRFYTGKPVVPFGESFVAQGSERVPGFGLSYSSFKYTAAGAQVASVGAVNEMLNHTAQQRLAFPSASMLQEAAPLVQYQVPSTLSLLWSHCPDQRHQHRLHGRGRRGPRFPYPSRSTCLWPSCSAVQGRDKLEPRFRPCSASRVHVKAGETVSVYLYPSLADYTQVSLTGERSAMAGEYQIKFGLQETAELGMGFAETKLTLV